MKAARYLKITSLLVALVALVVTFLVVSDCADGTCGTVRSWRLSQSIMELVGADEDVDLPAELDLLVIGVDSRKGQDKMHCDAIHAIHVDLENDEIEFVNVPRGTFSHITMPEGWVPKDELVMAAKSVIEASRKRAALEAYCEPSEAVEGEGEPAPSEPDPLCAVLEEEEAETAADEVPVAVVLPEGVGIEPVNIEEDMSEIAAVAWGMEQYISNVCFYMGFDEFVSRVDKITGLETDYWARVGFSQAQGVLRALQLDPTSTLQFLRHRKSYGIGDNQRSYNQSIFLEDLLLTRLDAVKGLPATAQYALYKLVDTNMPLGVARALMTELDNLKEDKITHRTAPAGLPKPQEIHLDESNPDEQIVELYDKLKQYDPGFKVTDVQGSLVSFVRSEVVEAYEAYVNEEFDVAREELDAIIAQQLWHQIEDDEDRRDYIVSIALLDSSIEYRLEQSEADILERASSLVWTLELEPGAGEWAQRIQKHLNTVLGELDEAQAGEAQS